MKIKPYLIAQTINFCTGLLLFVLSLFGYLSPEWFFTEKYDVIITTSQSATILRVMMGFMTTVGGLWITISLLYENQKRVLLFTGVLTMGFILSRVGGLLLDCFDQYFTYIELLFW
jgi:hypothetical protein